MSTTFTVRRLLRDVAVLAALGGLVAWGTRVVLERFAPDAAPVGVPLQDVAFGPEVLEEEDVFLADLRAAAELVRQRWSYLEHRSTTDGFDLDQRLAEAVELLADGCDGPAFSRALAYLIGGLRDGHAFAAAEPYTLPGDYRWPFTLVEVAEGLMVDGVAVSTSWAQPPEELPERGDLLLAVDDRPVDAWIAEAQEFVSASTPDARRLRAVERMVRFDRGDVRTFRFARLAAGGELVTRELRIPLPRSFISVPAPALRPTEREHRRIEDDLGYFRPGSLAPPEHEDWSSKPELRDEILAEAYAGFDAVFEDLSGSRGWILDLRGNPGGTDLLGSFLVHRFIEEEFVYYRLASLRSTGWGDPLSSTPEPPPGKSRAAGPLVVLVDERTFSTADNVATCLEASHPDVRFVGRPNGAGTGAPRSFDLPRTGSRIGFCTMRVWTPDGEVAEGRSVALTQRVTWTRGDVLEERDPDLAAALELLAD